MKSSLGILFRPHITYWVLLVVAMSMIYRYSVEASNASKIHAAPEIHVPDEPGSTNDLIKREMSPMPLVNAYGDMYSSTSFSTVFYVALLNALFNLLRPDPSIRFQMRMPRILWELCIMVVAKLATNERIPSNYILLALMTGSTACVDIFIWAPLFAAFASFESCSGGWFTRRPRVCVKDYKKGVIRLMVSAQSTFSGLFYLATAVRAWGVFTALRERQREALWRSRYRYGSNDAARNMFE